MFLVSVLTGRWEKLNDRLAVDYTHQNRFVIFSAGFSQALLESKKGVAGFVWA